MSNLINTISTLALTTLSLDVKVRAHRTNDLGVTLKTHASLEALKGALKGFDVTAQYLAGGFYNMAVIEDGAALQAAFAAFEAFKSDALEIEAVKVEVEASHRFADIADEAASIEAAEMEIIASNRYDLDWD